MGRHEETERNRKRKGLGIDLEIEKRGGNREADNQAAESEAQREEREGTRRKTAGRARGRGGRVAPRRAGRRWRGGARAPGSGRQERGSPPAQPSRLRVPEQPAGRWRWLRRQRGAGARRGAVVAGVSGRGAVTDSARCAKVTAPVSSGSARRGWSFGPEH